MNRKETLQKYGPRILTAGAFAALVFLHFFRMTGVPYGLNVDEAGSAYDAFCLVHFGVDRHLKSFPLYFINYGDGQNALCTYLIAICIRLFGLTRFAIRLPIALSAIAGGVFGWLFARRNFGEKHRYFAAIWLTLYAVLPVFVMTQRFSLESHFLLGAGILTIWAADRALRENRPGGYLLFGLTAGVTLYTYALSYIVLPIFLLLFLLYVIRLRRWRWKNIFAFAVPFAILAIPLVLVQLINLLDLPEVRLGVFTLTKLPKYRIGELGLSSVWSNLKDMFFAGLLFDDLQYNTLPQFGTLLYVSIPFCAVGCFCALQRAIRAFRDRELSGEWLISGWFVGELVMGCLLKGYSAPNSSRMIGIYFALLFFVVIGLYEVWSRIRGVRGKRIFAAVTGALYGVGAVLFAGYYFTAYNEDVFPLQWLFAEPYEEVGDYLEKTAGESFQNRTFYYPWGCYIYYVLEFQVSPYEVELLDAEDGFWHGKNRMSGYPATVDLQANYVVYKTDTASMEYLDRLGFERATIKDYTVYKSPFDRFSQETAEDAAVAVDVFSPQNGAIQMRGWCVNQETHSAYETLAVRAGGDVYPAEPVERSDVAELYREEGCRMAGFSVSLPEDILSRTDALELIGDGEVIYRQVRVK